MARAIVTRPWIVLGMLALLAAAIFAADVRQLPGIYMPAVAYMVPVLLAAYLIPRPRWVAGVAIWALALQIMAYLLEGQGMSLLPASYVGGLSLVSLLCVVLSGRAGREAGLRTRLEAIVQQMPSGVLVAEAPSGKLIQANRQAEQIWGIPSVSADSVADYGRNFGFHPNGEPFSLEEIPLVRSLRKGEQVVDEEITIERRDGTRAVLSASSAPIRDGLGRIAAAVLVVSDITERKRAELEQRHLAAVVESSGDAIIGKTLDGVIVTWNEGAEGLYGFTAAEAAGRPISILVPPGHADELGEILQRIKQGQAVEHYETERVRKNGERVDVAVTVSPIRDDAGRVVGASTIARDITDRKRFEAERERMVRELDLERARLSAVLEQMPAAVIIAEAPSGRLLLSNQQIERVWGHPFIPSESVDEYGAWKGFHVDGGPYAPEEWPLARSIRTGEVVTDEEALIPRGNGTLGTITLSSSPIRDREGRIVAGVVIMADITERKAAETERERLLAEVQRRAAELDAANKELEAFSYSVSHDLRAPLRTIDGFSQALLEDYADSLDEVGKDYLQRVRAGSQRMGRLIDDMLTLSRVTRGEMHREQVDLSAVAEGVAAELREREPERRVKFKIQSGLVVEGDARLLRVVIGNLLGNAWKFTSRRELARIEFGTTKKGGRTAYFVRDNGVGFDMAYVDKLFGAFQRLHSETDFPGTGVGLATVMRIVRRHGGRIWAEGKVDEGATFFFTLPGAA